MKTIAVIPARGGSQRIPKKNIRSFHGIPIIVYSIRTAREANLFDEVIVSTDDEAIATIAMQNGATVYGRRSLDKSDDQTGVLEVVAYELEQLEQQQLMPTEVCLIYATAPLMRVCDLKSSYQTFRTGEMDFVFSAAEFSSPIFRAFKIRSNGRAKMFQPENYHKNSQDLPRAYHDAGQFCWGRREAILDPEVVVFSERSQPYVLPANRVLDIDTPEDWVMAEWIYAAHQANQVKK